MWMDEREIRESFVNAENQREQLKILAQLNATSTKRIAKIVGVEDVSRKTYRELQQIARGMASNGTDIKKIAKLCGVRIYTVGKWCGVRIPGASHKGSNESYAGCSIRTGHICGLKRGTIE